MHHRAFPPQWQRLLKQYRKIQRKWQQATGPAQFRRLGRRLRLLARRILRYNRRWRLGFATAALVAWLQTPATGQFQAVIRPGDLDGSTGIRLPGLAPDNLTGRSVSGIGDLNGDGMDDFAIGAPDAIQAGMEYGGEVYVVFGQSAGFDAEVDLSALDGDNGFTAPGVDVYGYAGLALSGAGDINGDGIDDLVIGAPGAFIDENEYNGRAYVVFGRNTGFPAELDLAALDGSDGFAMTGLNAYSYTGFAVSEAGDVNGDEIEDLLVSAPGIDSLTGETYVIFGRNTGFGPEEDLSALDGNNGFAVKGISEGDISGISVSGIGDFNGDGMDDFAIGAFQADPGGIEQAGAGYIIFGRETGFEPVLELALLNSDRGVLINGAGPEFYTGISVSGAGDINGDGLADLVIGAPYANSGGVYSGEAYVLFGQTDGFGGMVTLNNLDGENGFRIPGLNAYDEIGRTVSGVGDINGDGLADVALGAPYAATNEGNYSGLAYFIFGSEAPFTASFNLNTLDGNNGFVLEGDQDFASLGQALAGAGDINGDGFQDVIVGAPYTNIGDSNNAGEVYILFGRDIDSAVPDPQSNMALTITPNPTASTITVRPEGLSLSERLVLTLYDRFGREVTSPRSEAPIGDIQLDLSGLPAGVYLLRAAAGERVVTRRIVKR